MDEMYPQMLKPINWKDFKALSVEQQLAYLNGIREIYHPSMIDFSTLFGCSEYLFREHAKEIGFKAESFYNHKKKTPEETRKWYDFLDQAEWYVSYMQKLDEKRWRGRPIKAPDQIRSVTVKVRLTNAEYEDLLLLADKANLTVSEYIRNTALKGEND